MESYVPAEVVVKKSRTGCGLFAARRIQKGDFIIEYTGKKIPTAVADTLGTRYLFEIDSEWTIDGAGMENTARWINHACEPNSECELTDGRIFFFAVRDIEQGEEITVDYGEEYFDEFIRPAGCRCEGCVTRNLVPTAVN